MTQNESILTRLFQKLHPVAATDAGHIHEAGSTACVFDMDSTLFCVSSRTEKILREFAEVKDGLSEGLTRIQPLLRSIELNPKDWGIRSALERHQADLTLEEFLYLRDFWTERFFSDDYLRYDILYDRANEFARLCQTAGFEVLYLTGRDQEKMRTGTLRQLMHWGFPLKSPEDLIMRPKHFEKDEDFKVQMLNQLKTRFKKLYFFENEPVIINRVLRADLDVNVIYMDSTHSGREEPPHSIDRIDITSYARFFETRKDLP